MMNTDKKIRLILLCLYSLTLTSTLVTSLSLGWAVRIFGSRCPLYSTLQLSEVRNKTIRMKEEGTVWTDALTCDFCTFSSVSGTVLAIICFWFYILLSHFRGQHYKGTTTVPPDIRLLLPSMVFNMPMLLIALVVACLVTDGRSFLCRQASIAITEDCNALGAKEWMYPENGRQGWNYIRAAQWGAWCWVAFLTCTIIVGMYRVYQYSRDVGLSFTVTSWVSASSSSSSSSNSTLEEQLKEDEGRDLQQDDLEGTFYSQRSSFDDGDLPAPNFFENINYEENGNGAVGSESSTLRPTVKADVEEVSSGAVSGRGGKPEIPELEMEMTQGTVTWKGKSGKQKAKSSNKYEQQQ